MPVTHRRPLSIFTVLAACLWLAGCQPGGSHWPADVLVVGQVAEPRSLDPHVATSLNDFRILVNVYEGLV